MPADFIAPMRRHAQAVRSSQTEDAGTLVHGAIAVALATQGYGGAMEMIDEAIAIHPSSAHAHGHGSVIATWAGLSDKSIALSQQALRLSPFDPLSVMPLAGQEGAHVLLGDYPQGLAFAQRALGVYPNHTPSCLLSIVCLVRLGRLGETTAFARNFIAVFPSYRIIAQAPVLGRLIDELRLAGLPLPDVAAAHSPVAVAEACNHKRSTRHAGSKPQLEDGARASVTWSWICFQRWSTSSAKRAASQHSDTARSSFSAARQSSRALARWAAGSISLASALESRRSSTPMARRITLAISAFMSAASQSLAITRWLSAVDTEMPRRWRAALTASRLAPAAPQSHALTVAKSSAKARRTRFCARNSARNVAGPSTRASPGASDPGLSMSIQPARQDRVISRCPPARQGSARPLSRWAAT